MSCGAALLAMFSYVLRWTQAQTVSAFSVGSGCAGTVIRWLDFVVVHNPERDFWRMRDGKKVGEAPRGSWGKFKWFFSLWIAQRYDLLHETL